MTSIAAVRLGSAGVGADGPVRPEGARSCAGQAVRPFTGARTASSSVLPFPRLTDREREVLDLVARGLPHATIATRLFLSDKTVRNDVSACLAKLQVASRAEAVAVARDAGLGG